MSQCPGIHLYITAARWEVKPLCRNQFEGVLNGSLRATHKTSQHCYKLSLHLVLIFKMAPCLISAEASVTLDFKGLKAGLPTRQIGLIPQGPRLSGKLISQANLMNCIFFCNIHNLSLYLNQILKPCILWLASVLWPT